ncbi:MAG TPA: transcriptional regulator [Rhizobiales bacterium]|nr:transcriptional regulator [Hyphomicrobiales bacterium]
MSTAKSPGPGPIVSSSHLASGEMPALSEFEFGLILASHAFERWMVRCMAAAGIEGLSPLDVLVLHSVNHRDRAKTLASICTVLSIEDIHLVTYAIRKLEKSGLVKSGRAGKEKTVEITREGAQACERYKEIREELLVKTAKALGMSNEAASGLAAELRALSGHYAQAARSAASL